LVCQGSADRMTDAIDHLIVGQRMRTSQCRSPAEQIVGQAAVGQQGAGRHRGDITGIDRRVRCLGVRATHHGARSDLPTPETDRIVRHHRRPQTHPVDASSGHRLLHLLVEVSAEARRLQRRVVVDVDRRQPDHPPYTALAGQGQQVLGRRADGTRVDEQSGDPANCRGHGVRLRRISLNDLHCGRQSGGGRVAGDRPNVRTGGYQCGDEWAADSAGRSGDQKHAVLLWTCARSSRRGFRNGGRTVAALITRTAWWSWK